MKRLALLLARSGFHSNSADRPFVPRRAMMYVPGSDVRKLAKIPALGADCVCLDCEDGVAMGDAKLAARANVRKILTGEMPIDFGASEKTVRVNSLDSGLCRLDVEGIFSGLDPARAPSAVHLPKVEEPEHLREFAQMFGSSFDAGRNKIGLIVFIESAAAMVRLKEICVAAKELAEDNSPLVPEALVFGSDDFVASIGAVRTKEASELTYARQKLVTCAKAFGLQAIDLVHIDYKDLEGLRTHSELGARMGFTGKQVIHPGQVGVVHEAFKPSPEKIEWAKSLTAEFLEHERSGRGAFVFRGAMIDAPLVKQARNIVDLARKIEGRSQATNA